MTENMNKFLQEAEKDAALAAALENAETPEAVAALAAEKGFALDEADLRLDEPQGELADEALDDVAGGMTWLSASSFGFGKALKRKRVAIGKAKTRVSGLVHINTGGMPLANNLLHYDTDEIQMDSLVHFSDDDDNGPHLMRL